MASQRWVLEQSVGRGAALLDEVRPGWAAAIASDRLAMESCNDCILGQLYGSYEHGWRMALETMPAGLFFRAGAYGFTAPIIPGTRQNMDDFATLGDLWRDEIRKRLEMP